MTFFSFSKNGKLLPIDQAVIQLSSIEYMYGFGAYESIRVVKGYILFIRDHVERLLYSASVITLEHGFLPSFIEKAIRDLVSAIGDSETYNLKALLIGGSIKEKAELIILPLAPLFPDKKLYRDGVKTISISYERFLPQAKTLNMLPSYLFYRKAKLQGCYDALFKDMHGNVTEGTRTNFFCIRGKSITTPPLADVLAGVTRKYVIKSARENGFGVEERSLPYAELQTFDGAFLTGTSIGIVPIQSIDAHVWPQISPSVRELMRLFERYKDSLFGK